MVKVSSGTHAKGIVALVCSAFLVAMFLSFPLPTHAATRAVHSHLTSYLPSEPSNNETSDGTPSLVGFNDGTGNFLYVAWTGDDNPHHLNVFQSVNGGDFENKNTLTDSSVYGQGPAIAYFKPSGSSTTHLYVAFEGGESPHGLVHIGWYNHTGNLQGGNSIKINGVTQSTSARPSITGANGKLYCAWKGATNNNIYIATSTDGLNWSNLVKINDTTFVSPVLTGFNGLHVTFSGTNTTIYTGIYVDGNPNLQNHTSIPQTSNDDPGTFSFGGKLWLAWTGVDGARTVNYASSTDGFHFSSPAGCSNPFGGANSSNWGVALGSFNGHLFCAYPQWVAFPNLNPVLVVAKIA